MFLQDLAIRIFGGRTNKAKGEAASLKKEDITFAFARKLSTPIVDLIYPIKFITPNRVTWLGFFSVLLACFILIYSGGNLLFLFIVVVLYWFSSILDLVDGGLARKRNVVSLNGAWLDDNLEYLKGVIILFAIGFYIQDSEGNFTLQVAEFALHFNTWFMVAVALGASAIVTLMAKSAHQMMKEPVPIGMGHVYIIGLFILLNIMDWMLVLFAIGSIITIAMMLIEKTFFHKENKIQ
ncbi:MAG: CDP-alcohol phosphatidyltransferase family protein [Candidatus Hodarchaeales archaeon]